MAVQLVLDGTALPNPTDFKISKYKLTKSGRDLEGNMHMDVKARKRKFFITYAVLSGPQVIALENILDSDTSFYTLTYNDNGIQGTAIVYVGSIDRDRFRTDGVWYWKNVRFDLIER
jgi:hypothetical protein